MYKLKRINPATSLIAVIYTAALFSCNRVEEPSASSVNGSLKIEVANDSSLNTKSDESIVEWENIENFSILISKGDEPYASFEKVTDLPEENIVTLQPNDYTIELWWGANNPTGFDSPFFYGNQDFTVKANEQTEASVVATMYNAKLNIIFTDGFRFRFSEYSEIGVQIYNERAADNPLYFDIDEQRTPYVSPDSIFLQLALKKSDGTQYSYGLFDAIDVKSQDFITITLDAETDDSSSAFNVSINDETNRIDVDKVIPYSDIVKSNITSLLSFYSPLSSPELMPNENNNKFVYIKSEAGLKSIYLNHNSELLTSNGIESGASLLDSNIKEKLMSVGIEVDANDDNLNSYVDFSQFIATSKLYGADILNNIFEITATDYNNSTITTPFEINIVPVDYTIPTIVPGDIWCRTFAFSPMQVDPSITDKFNSLSKYEFSSDGGVTWSELSGVTSVDSYSISNLEPNTTYKIRYSYVENYTTVDVTTYPETQITNGNLNTYSSTLQSFCESRAPIYDYTFTGWCNNNATTLSPQKKHNYNNWPSTEGTTDAQEGSGAAVIQTVAYGTNTCVEYGNVIDNVASGYLSLGSDGRDQGAAFYSKPTSISYYYKFVIQNGHNHIVEVKVQNKTGSTTTTLGEGSFADKTEKSSYTKKTIDITYNNLYPELAPTHLVVTFRSTESDDIPGEPEEVTHYWGSIGAFTWPLDEAYLDTKYLGNRLWIDNINLEYNK